MKIDEYVTHYRSFAEINDGFHDMHVSLNWISKTWRQLIFFMCSLVTVSDASLTWHDHDVEYSIRYMNCNGIVVTKYQSSRTCIDEAVVSSMYFLILANELYQ